jgi:DNA-binding NtrC family response regulator
MPKNGKILIVDDEVDITEVLSEVLSETALEIQTAHNGKEALDKIHSEQFDAVLSDLNMPVMPGMELLRTLRKEGCYVPFVVLTGHGEKKAAIEALKLSAYDFLDKPWNDDQIISIMAKAIELGQQYNLWCHDQELVSGLDGINAENAEAAIIRMKTEAANKKD